MAQLNNWILVNANSINDLPREEFPSAPGCYAVYCDGVLVYIGQTTNLFKRMGHHNFRPSYGCYITTPWGGCNRLAVKFRPSRRYGDWAMVELRLIKRLQPVFNCVGSVRKRRAA